MGSEITEYGKFKLGDILRIGRMGYYRLVAIERFEIPQVGAKEVRHRFRGEAVLNEDLSEPAYPSYYSSYPEHCDLVDSAWILKKVDAYLQGMGRLQALVDAPAPSPPLEATISGAAHLLHEKFQDCRWFQGVGVADHNRTIYLYTKNKLATPNVGTWHGFAVIVEEMNIAPIGGTP